MRPSVERLEGQNNALKTTHEELLSTHEERQSVNEELKNSRGELQSLNEELITTNRQLNAKVRELEEANNDLRNLLASSEVATICLDRELRLKWLSDAAREAFSIRDSDIGHPIAELSALQADKWLPADTQTTLESGALMQAEFKAAASNRLFTRRTLPCRTADGKMDGVIVTFTDITESQRKAKHELETRTALTQSLEQRVIQRTMQLRAVMFELAMAEERERRSIAMDLHDHLGQMLAVANMKLTGVLQDAQKTDLAKPLHEVAEILEQAGQAVRSLAFQISPPVLFELGLVPALSWLADEIQRIYGMLVTVEDDAADKPLNQAVRSVLFRAVRELLINTAKHAKVGRCEINVRRDGPQIVITVIDQGIGFDLAQIEQPAGRGGFGLVSVRERLSFIGGGMQIRSVPGSGTSAILSAPLLLGEQDGTEESVT